MTPKTTAQRIADCLTRHPDWPDVRVAHSANTGLAAVRAARLPGPAVAAAKQPGRGKTLDQFRAAFDVRERIRAGIQTHLAGVYLSDADFREAVGVPPSDWRRFADLDEFEPFRWRHRGVLYWAKPKMLAQMKEIVGAV